MLLWLGSKEETSDRNDPLLQEIMKKCFILTVKGLHLQKVQKNIHISWIIFIELTALHESNWEFFHQTSSGAWTGSSQNSWNLSAL